MRLLESASGQQAANPVRQSVEAERWNAEKALPDDEQFFGENAQPHLLSEESGGEVSRRRDQALNPSRFALPHHH